MQGKLSSLCTSTVSLALQRCGCPETWIEEPQPPPQPPTTPTLPVQRDKDRFQQSDGLVSFVAVKKKQSRKKLQQQRKGLIKKIQCCKNKKERQKSKPGSHRPVRTGHHLDCFSSLLLCPRGRKAHSAAALCDKSVCRAIEKCSLFSIHFPYFIFSPSTLGTQKLEGGLRSSYLQFHTCT